MTAIYDYDYAALCKFEGCNIPQVILIKDHTQNQNEKIYCECGFIHIIEYDGVTKDLKVYFDFTKNKIIYHDIIKGDIKNGNL